MLRSTLPVFRLLILVSIVTPWIRPAETTDSELDRKFTQTVKPFVASYCATCHGGKTPASNFSFEGYTNLGTVVNDYGRWALVIDKLTTGQMPPKGMKQPSDDARQAVIDWVKAVRINEARKTAGDPGVVLARRLSNSEYNYSVRDLTGQDLQPTREFPVDPANPAGFDNSGESLTMSSTLLNKYLKAARDVADHMVLTPDSIDFAPHAMLVETDRDKYAIQRIVNFYFRQPTDYADYFQAAWRYKNRAALGKPRATLASTAADTKVSAKYLPMVWQILEEPTEKGKPEAGPVAKLQGMWRALPAPGPDQDAAVRAKCVEMRDFVTRIRFDTSMAFFSPAVRGLPAGSQPLLNWKLRQFNTNRRKFDARALRNDTDPAPVAPEIPRYPGLHQEGGFRWAALLQKSRVTDPDLTVPAAERPRYEASFARLANVFPDHFFVSERGRYFPDDSEDKGRLLSAGYHNVMGYWRDDVPLSELILEDKGQKELDRLWLEFDYIAAHTQRTWDQFWFNQSGAVDGKGAESGTLRPADRSVFATESIFWMRDKYLAKAKSDPKNDPAAPDAIETQFKWIDDTLRMLEKAHKDAEPHHMDSLMKFAARAYRHPLSPADRDEISTYYRSLRDKDGLNHEEAVRDSIVRVLMSPRFLYRVDLVEAAKTARAKAAAPIKTPLSSYALASRLSYFLWSSIPDDELLSHAASGDLQKPEVLLAQARRMLKDERARGLAIEFGGNWLDFRRFEDHNAVDRERFPSFTNDLREAMYQEPIRLIDDAVRSDRSILDLIYGNYTFVNPVLAKHYGMPEVKGNNDTWVRIDDANKYGRGGLLPMSVFLTQNAPGLRTSPVKRGYWVVKRVLGEVIPPPPPNVPELPKDEGLMDLPLPAMLAKHRSVQLCASCHARFDSFGLVFEGYGPVGERREKDLAGRAVETKAAFPGGGEGTGVEGVQAYIRGHRQKDYVENMSSKLLAYALGRSLQFSDDLLVEQMDSKVAANGYKFRTLVETIVTSPQFMYKRSADPQQQKGE